MTIPAGLSAFPVTPCTPEGRVDTEALRRVVDRLVTAKVDSLGLLGSTGTYMFLSPTERRRALDAGMDAAGAIPVMVGVGALRTDDAVRYAKDAKAAGAAAGLLAAVSYNPLTEDEVFEHFATVARDSGLPIVIYDNPTATHFRFAPGLVERLAQVDGIIAIKNPGREREELASHLAEQRARLPTRFAVGYSGDWFCAEAMIAGADIWCSVLAGILPKPCLDIVAAAKAGDAAEARRLNAELDPVWDVFRRNGGLKTVYAMAALLDICQSRPPLPILPLPDADRQAIAAFLVAAQAL
jgi:4-hydroxy-tetrahydrodipicolinate synthase